MAAAVVATARLDRHLNLASRRFSFRPTKNLLVLSIADQSLEWFIRTEASKRRGYVLRRRFRVSTSRHGAGQVSGSNQTPLGWHRIASKIGGGHPIGTAFKSRQAIGFTWQGMPDAVITHRILWLEGVEPGFNRGGEVDSFARYIYIHGFGDETTLGKPISEGCIHVAGSDLMPLYEVVPEGTLVWIRL